MGELPRLTQGDSIKMSFLFPPPCLPHLQNKDSGAGLKHGVCACVWNIQKRTKRGLLGANILHSWIYNLLLIVRKPSSHDTMVPQNSPLKSPLVNVTVITADIPVHAQYKANPVKSRKDLAETRLRHPPR